MSNKIIDSRYELIERIGEGGMGTVFKAKDLDANSIIAIKFIHFNRKDVDAIKRFQREYQTLTKLRHENIVTVFDINVTSDGEYYITMEFVNGKTLRDLLDEQTRIDEDALINIFIQVASGLSYAHENNIIHCDVKPENIIIDAMHNVKIMDFGLAEDLKLKTNEKSRIKGTIAYMSPEQAKGDNIDLRSDLYSLGVVMYEAFSGYYPFMVNDSYSIIQAHQEERNIIKKDFSHLSEKIANIVIHLLEREPFKRYPSAEFLKNDLFKSIGKTTEKYNKQKMYIFSSEMVGRESEFEQLNHNLNLVRSGQGKTIFIHGESGIGKTRLIQELIKYGRNRKVQAFRANCEENNRIPYNIFANCLKQSVPGFDISQSIDKSEIELFKDIGKDIVKLIPEFSDSPFFKKGEISELRNVITDQNSFFDSILKYIEYLANKSPIILFLDDLEWIDEDSLTLLEYLSRNISNKRILICCAYRDDEIEKQDKTIILEKIKSLYSEHLISLIKLDYLRLGAIKSLIEQILGEMKNAGEEFYQKIMEETSGNPLYIENLIQDLVDDGNIYYDDNNWILSSTDLSKINLSNGKFSGVIDKIDNLNDLEKDIIFKASALGENIDCEVLQSTVDIEDEEFSLILKNLEKERLIIEDGLNYRFYHRKIKEILYDTLSDENKKKYHLDIAKLLTKKDNYDDYYNIAYHFYKAENNLDTIIYAEKAFIQARKKYQHHIVKNCLEWILELSNIISWKEIEDNSQLTQYSVVRELSDIYETTGEHKALIELVDKTLGKNPDFNQHENSKLLIRKAHNLKLIGQNDKALEILFELKSKLQNSDSTHITAHCYQELGASLLDKQKIDEALELFLAAKEIYESDNNKKHIGNILLDIGNVYWLKQDFDGSNKQNKEALENLIQTDDLIGIGTAYNRIGNVCIMKTEYKKAFENYEKAYDYFDKVSADLEKAKLNNNFGIIYSRLGDVEKSAHYTKKAYNLFQKANQLYALSQVSTNLAAFCLEGYYFDKVEEYVNKAEEILIRINQRHLLKTVYSIRGDLHLYKKQFDKAILQYQLSLENIDINKDVEIYTVARLKLALIYSKLNRIEESNKEMTKVEEYRASIIDKNDYLKGFYYSILSEILCKQKESNLDENEIDDLNKRINETFKTSYECFKNADIVQMNNVAVNYGKFLKEIGEIEEAKQYIQDARSFFIRNNMNLRVQEINQILDEFIDSEKSERDKYLSELHKDINKLDDELIKERIYYITFEINRLVKKVRELNQLLEVNKTIGSVLSINDLLNLVIDKIIEVTRGERGFVLLKEKNHKSNKTQLVFKAGRNNNMENLTNKDFKISNSVIKKILIEKKPVLVEDTLENEYFSKRKSIIDLDIKAIMGLPLFDNDKVIGVIYIDNILFKRNLFNENLDLVQGLTNQAIISIQNARMFDDINRKNLQIKKYNLQLEDMVEKRTQQLKNTFKELEVKNKELELKNVEMVRELEVATSVQKGILPHSLPDDSRLRINAKMKPMMKVSGDYYDVIKLDNDNYVLLVADVSGHGVPSALVTTMAKIAFVNFSDNDLTTAKICEKVNTNLLSNLEGGEFYLTAFIAKLDLKNRKLQFTSAGHPSARLFRKNNEEILKLDCMGFLIGITEEAEYDYKEIDIEEDDRLVIFSDGIIEARNQVKDFFGDKKLDNLIKTNPSLTGKELITKVYEDIDTFREGTPANDDTTILVADILKI